MNILNVGGRMAWIDCPAEVLREAISSIVVEVVYESLGIGLGFKD